ncbi:MAG: response regulator [Gemmataceae bacterium]
MLSSQGPAECTARCRDLRIAATLIKPIKQADQLREITHAFGLRVPAAESGATRSAPVPAVRPLRILLAEDNAINRRLAVAILQKQGHVVETAEDGRQVLAALDRAAFDLVLMDVQMPDMDGLQATAAIRAREQVSGGHQPIIAMTAHALKGDRERCLDAGMDGYVAKPLRPTSCCTPSPTRPGVRDDAARHRARLGLGAGDGRRRPPPARRAGRAISDGKSRLAGRDPRRRRGRRRRPAAASSAPQGGLGAFAARPAVDAALHLETLGRQGDLAPAAGG